MWLHKEHDLNYEGKIFMTSIVPTLMQDSETARRVARVLLKHIGPRNRDEAITILDSRIGVYIENNSALITEVDRYFN